jgi:hypothetical protein
MLKEVKSFDGVYLPYSEVHLQDSSPLNPLCLCRRSLMHIAGNPWRGEKETSNGV